MTKPEWGSKHICAECGTRYYDMERTPVVCPKCDAPVKIVPVKSRRTAASRSAKRAETTKATNVAEAAVKKGPTAPGDDTAAETVEGGVASADVGESADGGESDDDDDDDDDDAVIEDVGELGEDEKDLAEAIDGAVEKKDTDT